MMDNFRIEQASLEDVAALAVMVGELLDEIMSATGTPAFNFDLEETTARLQGFLEQGRYFVLMARHGAGRESGFIALYESCALYAEGVYGMIPELYVRPAYRSQGVGRKLLEGAKAHGAQRGWTRLEVTTPPLPQFDRTLAFYEREGFAISGGRKLRLLL
ncbi:MAG: GNAT family N-acetyltransferase [Gammaproteobacteria bacterium]|jgi:GNAT superfamily N-acetyltransferase